MPRHPKPRPSSMFSEKQTQHSLVRVDTKQMSRKKWKERFSSTATVLSSVLIPNTRPIRTRTLRPTASSLRCCQRTVFSSFSNTVLHTLMPQKRKKMAPRSRDWKSTSCVTSNSSRPTPSGKHLIMARTPVLSGTLKAPERQHLHTTTSRASLTTLQHRTLRSNSTSLLTALTSLSKPAPNSQTADSLFARHRTANL